MRKDVFGSRAKTKGIALLLFAAVAMLFSVAIAAGIEVSPNEATSSTHFDRNSSPAAHGSSAMEDFLCGDANGDGVWNISDAVYLVAYIFSHGPAPDLYAAGDGNCDQTVNISDAVYLVAYIFAAGPAPCADCLGAPAGTLLGIGNCKGNPMALGAATEELRRCVQWQYDGVGTLLLTHVNATFNCCPETETHISVEGNTITITEVEISGICYCICLYDLDFQIVNLPAGEYTINVTEPYVSSPPLSFTVDLVATPTGEYCVTSE